MRGLVRILVGSSLIAGCGSEPARDLRVETTIQIGPGEERYECYRVNVDSDVYAAQISTDAAVAVHHQILALTDDTEPEGSSPCGLALDISKNWIFQAGGNPLQLSMPPGVAYLIPAGKQLLLQMHLFNPTDQPMESTVGVDLRGIAEADLESYAQLIAAGSLNLDLPPAQATTVRSKCTLDESVRVFGVLPHMHFLGTSFRTWIDGQEAAMLYDGTFDFERQTFQTFDPIELPVGSALNVECNYFNSTGDRVKYGSSARDEMCFALTYYYPAIETQGPICIN